MKEQEPALIILDVMLPDEDGLTILKALRSMLHSYVLIAKYRFIRIVHVHGKTLGVFFSCVTLL